MSERPCPHTWNYSSRSPKNGSCAGACTQTLVQKVYAQVTNKLSIEITELISIIRRGQGLQTSSDEMECGMCHVDNLYSFFLPTSYQNNKSIADVMLARIC